MNNMKAQIILFASAVLMVCSCQKENPAEVSTAKNSIVATIEEDTKTTVDGTDVTWKENDQIDIAFASNKTITNNTYKLVNTYAGKKEGVFEGEEISYKEDCYAVYPAVDASYTNGVKFVFTTPGTQEAAENVGKYMQMYSTPFKMGDKVKFQHLNCALKVTIKSDSETTISKIEVRNSKGSDWPSKTYTITNGASVEMAKSAQLVTLNINETISGSKDYYIALAPKAKGVTWQIIVYYGSTSMTATTAGLLEAGKLYTGSFKLK